MTIVPFKSRGESALEEFVKAFKAGKLDDALIILTHGEEMSFLPLTETPEHYLGWMCIKCAHALMHSEDEGEGE